MLAIPPEDRKNRQRSPPNEHPGLYSQCKLPHGTKGMWVLQGHHAPRTKAFVEANDPATGTESKVPSVKTESAIADASH